MLRKLENKLYGRTKTIDKRLYSLDEIKDTFDNIDETIGTGLIKFNNICTNYSSGMYGDEGIERVLRLVENKFYSEGNEYLESIGEIYLETNYQVFEGDDFNKHYLTLESWYTDSVLDTLTKKSDAGKANISFEVKK